MTTTVRDYIEDTLPADFTNSSNEYPCHEGVVSEDGVTLTFKRSIWSLVDSDMGDLFIATIKDEDDEDVPDDEKFFYQFADGAKEAILESFKKIIKDEVVDVADENDMSYYLDIPDSGDVEELEISITFTGDRYLNMDEEVFSDFSWNYVATFYNMDDAGTYNHPYLWGNAQRALNA